MTIFDPASKKIREHPSPIPMAPPVMMVTFSVYLLATPLNESSIEGVFVRDLCAKFSKLRPLE
jgi:hypothetical protein